MKKYIVYAILMAGTTLSSCSSSFLDQEPPLYIEPGDIYNDATNPKFRIYAIIRTFMSFLLNYSII